MTEKSKQSTVFAVESTRRPKRGNGDPMSELYARFFQGLSDATRVRIVSLVLERPRTVTELVHVLGSPQGRVSSHLACLRWCGFVEGIREGRTVTYQVTDERVRTLLESARAMLEDNSQRVATCFVLSTSKSK